MELKRLEKILASWEEVKKLVDEFRDLEDKIDFSDDEECSHEEDPEDEDLCEDEDCVFNVDGVCYAPDDEDEDDCDEDEDCCDCENCEYTDECEANEEFDFEGFIKNLEYYGKIIDVDIDESNVICTFADGEVQTAYCHPEDEDKWSLETGIAVCLGKYLVGGSNRWNRLVHQGVKVYRNKIREAAKKFEREVEEQRIRENQKRKRERYLKRRAERKKKEDISKATVTISNGDRTIQISIPKFRAYFPDGLSGLYDLLNE